MAQMRTKSKSSIIIKKPAKGWNTSREPILVGEILLEEFLNPMALTQAELARKINCDIKTINRLCNGKCSLSPKLAVQLSMFFGNTPEFWLHLQNQVDVWEARKELKSAS